MNNITVEEIKAAIHRMDLLMRPYVVFMHQGDYATVKELYPDFEKDYQVEITELIEKGKCLLMNRKDLEPWLEPWVDPPKEVEHE